MGVPLSFVRGETVTWSECFLEYKPADGWALRFAFRGVAQEQQFDVTAVADETKFTATITSAATAALPVGRYDWQAWVEKDGKRHYVGSGQVQLLQDLATATAVDSRTKNEKILAAIDDAIEGLVTDNVQAYTIGGRALTRLSPRELQDLRTHYSQLVASEKRQRAGQSPFRTVRIQFVKP